MGPPTLPVSASIPAVHVVCGWIPANAPPDGIADAGERLLSFPFMLSDGPIRYEQAPHTWLRVLDEFHQLLALDASRVGLLEQAAAAVLDAARSGTPLIVWSGSAARDQLLVGLLFHVLRTEGLPPGNLALVSVGLDECPIAAVAMSTMSREQLTAARDTATPGTEAVSHAYARAWRAWASSRPEALRDFASVEPGAPSALLRCMQALTKRYPDSRTGLPHWDLRLLQLVAERGPRLSRVLGYLLAESASCSVDTLGASWAWWRLRRLAAPAVPTPLVVLDPVASADSMHTTTVRLTDEGLAVVRGEVDASLLNGHRDEVGGVSLVYPEHALWVSEAGTLALRGAV